MESRKEERVTEAQPNEQSAPTRAIVRPTNDLTEADLLRARLAFDNARARQGLTDTFEGPPPLSAAELIQEMLDKEKKKAEERAARGEPEPVDPREEKKKSPSPERILDRALPAFVKGLAIGSTDLELRVQRAAAIKEAIAAVEAKEKRVVFVGLSGTGKTSLAAASLRLWVKPLDWRFSDGQVSFVDCRTMALERSRHPLGQGEPQSVDRAFRSRLLVLDDLGQDPPVATSPIPDIVFERYNADTVMWVTTWMNLPEMAKRYGDGFARRVLQDSTIIQCGNKRIDMEGRP